jgi:WD40 repeat protein
LLVGRADGKLKIYRRDTRQLIITFRGHSDIVFGMQLSSDYKYLATAGQDKKVILWRPSLFDNNINTVRRITDGTFGPFYSSMINYCWPKDFN